MNFVIKDDLEKYLEDSHYINWKSEIILQKAKELSESSKDEIELIRAVYHFVRDEIKHSWDVQDKRVTITATDVLREKVGICLDARGNKPGVDAQMSLEKEQLAFPVRPEIGEIDYKEIYAEPLSITMQVLEKSTNAIYMYLHSLPDTI